MKHFKQARVCLKDAEQLQVENSQTMYRTAMAISCDMTSSLDELNIAKKFMDKANELKETEKIFEHEKSIFNLQKATCAFRANYIKVFTGQHIICAKFLCKFLLLKLYYPALTLH